jgi:hypothetical protein
VTPVFDVLSHTPTEEAIQNAMPVLDRFVMLMYDRDSECHDVNEGRKDLFTRKGRAIDAIPLTKDALHQHAKRYALQAGHCWGQTLHSIACYAQPG